MTNYIQKFKPAAPKKLLIFIAGTMWISVGFLLVSKAFNWLFTPETKAIIFIIPGIILSLIIHHFGFLKIVNKNLKRISLLSEKACIFSFISWRSYILIIIMIGMGLTLRNSFIPKHYLSIVYLGIGFALIFSSIRYFRNVFIPAH